MTRVEFYIALGQYLKISPDDLLAISSERFEYVPHPFPPDICREFCRNAIVLLLSLQRAGRSSGLEHILLLGLIITARHLSGENRTNFFDHATLNALLGDVKAVDTPTVAETEVIIWLGLIINWRSHSAAGPLPVADALLDYVLESFPVFRNWQSAANISRKFFWFQTFQDEWKACWHRGMQRFHLRQRSTTVSWNKLDITHSGLPRNVS
ncbi:hypothetical protein ABEF95_010604 [Exophiala dermatitidis]